ncbi:pentapeptide repeat-containing protein, partial [Desulfobacterota bacterium AH_259_B03_O07]|nr:pentapeptide repeat-containing protein [Desulfobacterota bacterium AH_259_B03_O07]
MKLINTHFLAQNRRSIIIVTFIVVLILIILALWFIPIWQANSSGVTKPEKRFEVENEARKTLAQIVGGTAILIGLFFTWKTLQVDKEGQITERFTRAMDQIGSLRSDGKPNLEIRLGGIYALERIARDSERDHWQIMEVLSTYVRENARWPSRNDQPTQNDELEENQTKNEKYEQTMPNADIQAILTIIGRRQSKYDKEGQNLNLSNTNLQKAYLWEANLQKANLRGANLQKAYLRGANLQKAYLWGANLQDADLVGAKLVEADLVGAKLRGAKLRGAKLTGANLMGVDLVGVNLVEADLVGANLRGANLTEANLTEAKLVGADLVGADLVGADLRGANLRGAKLRGAKLRGAKLM